MVDIIKSDLVQVNCPYCGDFWDYIIPDNFFWDEMDTRTVCCYAQNYGKPFVIQR